MGRVKTTMSLAAGIKTVLPHGSLLWDWFSVFLFFYFFVSLFLGYFSISLLHPPILLYFFFFLFWIRSWYFYDLFLASPCFLSALFTLLDSPDPQLALTPDKPAQPSSDCHGIHITVYLFKPFACTLSLLPTPSCGISMPKRSWLYIFTIYYCSLSTCLLRYILFIPLFPTGFSPD